MKTKLPTKLPMVVKWAEKKNLPPGPRSYPVAFDLETVALPQMHTSEAMHNALAMIRRNASAFAPEFVDRKGLAEMAEKCGFTMVHDSIVVDVPKSVGLERAATWMVAEVHKLMREVHAHYHACPQCLEDVACFEQCARDEALGTKKFKDRDVPCACAKTCALCVKVQKADAYAKVLGPEYLVTVDHLAPGEGDVFVYEAQEPVDLCTSSSDKSLPQVRAIEGERIQAAIDRGLARFQRRHGVDMRRVTASFIRSQRRVVFLYEPDAP